MSQAPGKPPGTAQRGRPRRFISQFAELELLRQPGGLRARVGWLLALLLVALSLVLVVYDMLAR